MPTCGRAAAIGRWVGDGGLESGGRVRLVPLQGRWEGVWGAGLNRADGLLGVPRTAQSGIPLFRI
ncbi:MAG: hypothetical protein ACQXXL_01790 [Candidatus Methanosuratincola sp.]|nr:hypothetical protein [Candidatus Methanosuratincola sp.]